MPDLPLADRHETVLPDEPRALSERLDVAFGSSAEQRIGLLRSAVADHPTSPTAWAALAAAVTDPVERYACARVGYHRGLDALRANGWGGVGLVRWERPSNRGFLRTLVLLREAARSIGEDPEVARIDAFLRDLDPSWDDARVDR
jgi:hypothetical protein